MPDADFDSDSDSDSEVGGDRLRRVGIRGLQGRDEVHTTLSRIDAVDFRTRSRGERLKGGNGVTH
jgi:hypothetical protein